MATTRKPRFHVLRNEEEVFTTEGTTDPDVSSGCIPATRPNTFEAAPGDTFHFTFTCRDENGLGYEFGLIRVRIDEAGKVKEILRPEAYVPRLFW